MFENQRPAGNWVGHAKKELKRRVKSEEDWWTTNRGGNFLAEITFRVCLESSYERSKSFGHFENFNWPQKLTAPLVRLKRDRTRWLYLELWRNQTGLLSVCSTKLKKQFWNWFPVCHNRQFSNLTICWWDRCLDRWQWFTADRQSLAHCNEL